MVDFRSIMDQIYEIQRIYSNLKHHQIKMDEVIIVSSIMYKLPHSWRDVKKKFRHMEEVMNLNQFLYSSPNSSNYPSTRK